MKAVSAIRAHVVRTLAGLALLLLPALAAAQSGPGVVAYRQARELLKANDCNAAISKYNEAINLERTNYRYYAGRGDCELKLRKFNEAIQSYRQALSQNKEFTVGHLKIASAYMKLRNYNGAIQALNSAYEVEKNASKRINWKLIAVRLLIKENRPQEAMAELNKVKAVAGDDARVTQLEGDIFAAQNNWSAAIASYQKAVDKMKAQPIQQTAKYYYSLGTAYFKSGNVAKAKEVWENLKPVPNYWRRTQALVATSGATYHIRVAKGYMMANLLDDAIEFSNKAIQAEPNNPAGYQMLASVQIRKGQMAQGLANLNKAAELQQDEAKRTRLYSSIVSRQFSSGDYSGALNTANRILAKSPTNAAVLGIKAQAEYQLGQFQNAIASAEKAIAAGKGDQAKVAGYQFTQGLAAKRAGNMDMAKTLFTQVQKASSPFRFAAKIEGDKISAR